MIVFNDAYHFQTRSRAASDSRGVGLRTDPDAQLVAEVSTGAGLEGGDAVDAAPGRVPVTKWAPMVADELTACVQGKTWKNMA